MNCKITWVQIGKGSIKTIDRISASTNTGGLDGPKETLLLGSLVRHSQSRAKKQNINIACSHIILLIVIDIITKPRINPMECIFSIATLPFNNLSKGVPSRPGKYFRSEKILGSKVFFNPLAIFLLPGDWIISTTSYCRPVSNSKELNLALPLPHPADQSV